MSKRELLAIVAGLALTFLVVGTSGCASPEALAEWDRQRAAEREAEVAAAERRRLFNEGTKWFKSSNRQQQWDAICALPKGPERDAAFAYMRDRYGISYMSCPKEGNVTITEGEATEATKESNNTYDDQRSLTGYTWSNNQLAGYIWSNHRTAGFTWSNHSRKEVTEHARQVTADQVPAFVS